MIYLLSETNNAVALTLSESVISNSSYFLFEVANEFNPYDIKYILLNNYSPTINRYDLVYFELSSTGSTTGGINVPLNLSEGQYYYKVYEMAQPTNDPSDIVKELEEGILIVEITKPNF
jgi:hypothetical protein